MTILKDYQHFNGRHPETGSIHNILAYQGVIAPHTGLPYSEALLLGVSGGIAFGYFLFNYAGYNPILSLLTRNTFDPLQTILERLGVAQTILQTGQAVAGEKNLHQALENGHPALVWADLFNLPYTGLDMDENNWDMQPLLVYGLDDETAWLAGACGRSLTVPAATLTAARARIKKDKFRLVTLDAPDERKLPAAVQQGIWQCIRLYTEKPPKGSRDNFGLAALQKWADMLTNTRNPQSWERFFPVGERLLAALAGNAYLPGAYGWIVDWGTRPDADRSTYADFLAEAALLLNKPALNEAGDLFRQSGRQWQALAEALLPDDRPLLEEARTLKLRRRQMLAESGSAAAAGIHQINVRLNALPAEATELTPFTAAEAAVFRGGLRQHVLGILNTERTAINALSAAMA